MRHLEAGINAISQWIYWIACGSLVAMMLATVTNMIMRQVYVPFGGTTELVGFLGAIAAGLALAYTQIKRGHISVDVIVQRFSPRAQGIVDSISHFMSAVFFGLLAWQAFLLANRVMERGQLSAGGFMIYWPFVFAIALGCTVLCLVLLLDLLRAVKR